MTRLPRALPGHACSLGIVVTAVVASANHRPPAAFFVVLFVLSAASFLTMQPWYEVATLLGFLFCTWIAGTCTVHHAWMVDGSYAYSVRPAAVLVAVGCLLQATRQSPLPAAEGRYRSLFAALCAATALASALAYAGLASFYDLDVSVLHGQLLNLFLIAGLCLFWTGNRPDGRYTVAQRLLPLLAAVSMLALQAGGPPC